MDKKLPLPSPIILPDGYILERTPLLGGSVSYGIRRYPETGLIDSGTEVGRFIAHPNELNEEELITMSSDLEPEIQRKGIARQIYKQAEIDTGKKIIPDQLLSEMSAPLHRDYGLGKEFGLSKYEDIIKRGVEKRAASENERWAGKIVKQHSPWTGEVIEKVAPPVWPPQVAKDTYERIKGIMNVHGLDKFRSVIPSVLKGAGVAGALAAPSADAAVMDAVIPGGVEELGSSPEQQDLDRRYLQRIRQLSERKK